LKTSCRIIYDGNTGMQSLHGMRISPAIGLVEQCHFRMTLFQASHVNLLAQFNPCSQSSLSSLSSLSNLSAPTQSLERNAATPPPSPTLSMATTAAGTTTTPIYSTCKAHSDPASFQLSNPDPKILYPLVTSFVSMWLPVEVGIAQSIQLLK
jgi:hypothetical protein